MLINNNNFKLRDVVTIKMLGGDEIIARLANENVEHSIEVTKPLVVMMAQQGFGLLPFMLTGVQTETITFMKQHVIAMVHTQDAVMKEYIKQTTGIIA